MKKIMKDKEEYILIEKEQYLDLSRNAENLKQRVNTCEELIRGIVAEEEKLVNIVATLTDKIRGKK
jgi:hypothetical protein